MLYTLVFSVFRALFTAQMLLELDGEVSMYFPYITTV